MTPISSFIKTAWRRTRTTTAAIEATRFFSTSIPVIRFRPSSESANISKQSRLSSGRTSEVVLESGWRLSDFKPGYEKSLTFRDSANPAKIWKIETQNAWPVIRSWKNFVFIGPDYLCHDGILNAYQGGATKPTWAVDLNAIVKGRKPPLNRMICQLIEDTIYLEADEHIFAINPSSGRLLWHRDLATDLGLQFGGFYGGGLNLAVFAKDGNVLVISFERRVVAIDLNEGKYLWHLEPDTFPECPFPIAYGGKVVLTSGAKRRLHRVAGDV